jgi:hypothetical protein
MKKALEGFGYFKGGQLTLKYADDLVLQSLIDRLNLNWKVLCYGNEC